MVIFENEEERDYFNNRMMIGEMARVTMLKILTKLETSDMISKEEIAKMQADSIDELKEEVRRLSEAEKDESFKEQADALTEKADELKDNIKQDSSSSKDDK